MIGGRKHLIMPILITLVLLAGCHHTEREFYPSGKPMIEKTCKGKKLDGAMVMWYASGTIKQKAMYRNDKLEGLLECWYANGSKELEEMYGIGMRNGRSRNWDEQGNLLEEKYYRNDTLNGSYKMWFSTGILKIDGYYNSGLYHGKWQYFSEVAMKVGEGIFVNGTGVLIGYDAMGHKNHEVNYLKNKKQGNEIEYDPNGRVKETKVFEQDRIVRVIKGG